MKSMFRSFAVALLVFSSSVTVFAAQNLPLTGKTNDFLEATNAGAVFQQFADLNPTLKSILEKDNVIVLVPAIRTLQTLANLSDSQRSDVLASHIFVTKQSGDVFFRKYVSANGKFIFSTGTSSIAKVTSPNSPCFNLDPIDYDSDNTFGIFFTNQNGDVGSIYSITDKAVGVNVCR